MSHVDGFEVGDALQTAYGDSNRPPEGATQARLRDGSFSGEKSRVACAQREEGCKSDHAGRRTTGLPHTDLPEPSVDGGEDGRPAACGVVSGTSQGLARGTRFHRFAGVRKTHPSASAARFLISVVPMLIDPSWPNRSVVDEL